MKVWGYLIKGLQFCGLAHLCFSQNIDFIYLFIFAAWKQRAAWTIVNQQRIFWGQERRYAWQWGLGHNISTSWLQRLLWSHPTGMICNLFFQVFHVCFTYPNVWPVFLVILKSHTPDDKGLHCCSVINCSIQMCNNEVLLVHTLLWQFISWMLFFISFSQ